MDIQHNAILELHNLLKSLKIPYTLIGGVAVQLWGEPRYTQDVDVTVILDMTRETELIHAIAANFSPRITDAEEFAMENRVLLVRSSSGCPIDFSLGLPGYEESMISRALKVDFTHELRDINVCTPEDLIIMKMIAGRPRDLDDIESIIVRQQETLDVGYIRERLADFAELLEMPELLDGFEKLMGR